MEDDNRRRALAEVVSVDAWHEEFSVENLKSDLHVDVAFGSARIGGESEVRFRLTLRRAEIVVIVPEHEPARVVRSSVRRDTPKPVTGAIEQVVKSSKELKLAIGGRAGAGTTTPQASVTASGSATMSKSRTQRAVLRQVINGMTVSQSQTADGEYRWEVSPPAGVVSLEGHPWDAKKAPRLKVEDCRADRSKGLPPAVRVEVRCLREDLEIEILPGGDKTALELLNRREAQRNRMIAAEAVVRTLLSEAGLFHEDLRDPYARITLAAITAEAER